MSDSPSDSLIVRRATRADVEALGRLGALLMRAHYTFNPQRFLSPGDDPEGGYAWFLETQLEEPDGAIFVATRDNTIVGYVWATLEPMSWKELRGPAGFIQDIVVDPHARETGAARELLNAAVNWLRESGAPRVMLWTATQNDRAQKVFHAAGFRDTMIEMTKEF